MQNRFEKVTDITLKRKREEAESDGTDALQKFMDTFHSFAQKAALNGMDKVEITVADTHRKRIDEALGKLGFSIKWGSYSGETYVTVSW